MSSRFRKAAFEKIAETIRPNDVFLLYMAGHGKAIRADYYFIPWEMRYENEQSIEKQGLSNKEIEALLATNHTSGVDELADYVGTVVREITFQRFGYEMVPMRSLSGDPFDIGCREGYDGPGCRP